MVFIINPVEVDGLPSGPVFFAERHGYKSAAILPSLSMPEACQVDPDLLF